MVGNPNAGNPCHNPRFDDDLGHSSDWVTKANHTHSGTAPRSLYGELRLVLLIQGKA